MVRRQLVGIRSSSAVISKEGAEGGEASTKIRLEREREVGTRESFFSESSVQGTHPASQAVVMLPS